MENYDQLKKIWDYLSVEDKIDSVDAIFVLGGSSLYPVNKAAELFKKGVSQNIAFISIGGRFGGEELWGMTESEKYKKELLSLGISEKNIFTEPLSTNTLDEAKAAIPFLRSKLPDLTSMILVSRPVHQRRAWATFQKQYGDVQYINIPADEPFTDDTDNALRLVQEIERLDRYGKKGDIMPQDVPTEILNLTAKVKERLISLSLYKE